MDVLLETSADPYAVARAAYFQRREAAILDRTEDASIGVEGETAVPGDSDFDAAIDEMDASDEPPVNLAPGPE